MLTKIQNEIKEAMKAKDSDKKDVLKAVVDKAKLAAKEQKIDVTNDIVISAIQKELKQQRQTIESIKEQTEHPLFKSTSYRISILESFLPKMMSREEVEQRAKEILGTGEYSNFGAKMKAVMAELRGKADNNTIKSVVQTLCV